MVSKSLKVSLKMPQLQKCQVLLQSAPFRDKSARALQKQKLRQITKNKSKQTNNNINNKQNRKKAKTKRWNGFALMIAQGNQ